MRSVLLAALLGSGCSLLLDAGPNTSDIPDADVDTDAATAEGLVNTTNPDLPYTCDDDTLALYHFDDEADLGFESCSNGAFTALGGQASERRANFGRAAVIANQGATLKSPETMVMLPRNRFTAEAWIKAPTPGENDQVVYIASSNDATASPGGRRFEFLLIVETGVWVLRAEVADEACDTHTFVHGGPIEDTDWHHVVLKAESDLGVPTLTMTIDGADAGAQGTTRTGLCVSGLPAHIQIGGSARRPDEVYGQSIDELRISTVLR